MTLFYRAFKERIEFIMPNDENVCYSENPSVDVEAIAKTCGITSINYVSPDYVSPSGSSNRHAMLKDTEIDVNKQNSKEKQRFAIAHEIFHFLKRNTGDENNLMQAVARQGETWKKNNAGTPEAIEENVADYFAAVLLVPTERFILWEDHADEDIAKAFMVEPKCIKKRRKEVEYELGILSPKALSSGVRIEETTPLMLDKLNNIFGEG